MNIVPKHVTTCFTTKLKKELKELFFVANEAGNVESTPNTTYTKGEIIMKVENTTMDATGINEVKVVETGALEETVVEYTEVYLMREAAGVSRKEISTEIGYQTSVYHLHESGKRKYSTEERREEFYNEVAYGLERIRKRRLMRSGAINIELNKDGELVEVLIYQPLSTKLYKEAIYLISTGKNIIQVSVELSVDEEELEKKLNKDEIDEVLLSECTYVYEEVMQRNFDYI